MTELGNRAVLSRVANPEDGRSSFAAVTPEGRARLRQVAPVYLSGIQEHFLDHLGAGEVRTLVRALGRVVAAEKG